MHTHSRLRLINLSLLTAVERHLNVNETTKVSETITDKKIILLSDDYSVNFQVANERQGVLYFSSNINLLSVA